ncbi:MAG: [protein-PII] uridylyltransferase [Planctomycetota bacterium]|nr:[protein-PII] uridylyltransferase [Planctomycetota bacterium]
MASGMTAAREPAEASVGHAVAQATESLGRLRGRIATQHAEGGLGYATCGLATDLFDALVIEVWQSVIAGCKPAEAERLTRQVALVAHGGFGRREMAPYSDIDLMLLSDGGIDAGLVANVARRLVQDLFDAGLTVGQSVRSVAEAAQLSSGDATIFSTLLDCRTLAGRNDLVGRLRSRLWGIVRRGRRRMTALLSAARDEERRKFGETVFLLEPNVKRSPGGLRDVQLIRWLGLVRWGDESWTETATLDDLARAGGLTRDDADAVRDAAEFLLRLRNELHLHAGKAADELTRDEQVRIAAARGIEAAGGMLGVERFMQDYFRHTRRVADVADAIAAECRQPPALQRWVTGLFGHRVDGRYAVGPGSIRVLSGAPAAATESIDGALRLLELSALYGLPVDSGAWQRVRAAVQNRMEPVGPAERRRFLALFEAPDSIGTTLRSLHEVGLLEQFVPPFAHARHLLQFNNYHKYTVDEHCIVAVEKAVALTDDESWLGSVWRQIKRKGTVLLALLIHDLGKGFDEDHSEVGARIARDVAVLFQLPDDEAEILVFLVHKHLLMAHLAFRRDVDDNSLVVRFAREVGSPEVLRMLTVLTAADVSAVGPGTWTRWKGDLLGDLYYRTLGYLDGESPSLRAERTGRALEALLTDRDPSDQIVELARTLPLSYLRDRDPEAILEHISQLARLPDDGVVVECQWQEETSTLAITVGTREAVANGIFHRLTGALTSQRLEILAADIHTLPGGLIIDHFVVHDPDFSGAPPAERLADIREAVRKALRVGDRPVFTRLWNPFAPQPTPASLLPTRVLFDNESSERSTILEVFTHDSAGLLYSIARTLFDAGISVQAAKIGTYSDQVVDAFHISDKAGRKITDAQQMESLRRALEKVATPPGPP